MAEDGQMGGFARGAEPTVTDLLDPIALEARLKEARARRAEVLARREVGRPPDPEASGEPPGRGAAVPFAPRRSWLDELDGDFGVPEPEPVPIEGPGPARLRPVLLDPRAGAAPPLSATPGERPPLVAPALPGAEADDQILAATRSAATRRRLPPAALLFVAGLGLGAAAVALAVRPMPEPPATVASNAASARSGDAAVTAGPEVSDAPVAITTPPTAPDPAAGVERPAIVATTTPPAGLAAPASEPAPPPMAPPDATIGSLIAAATPEPRPAPAGTETAAPEAGPTVAAAEATLPGTALPQRVSIHYPRSAQALATSVQATLRAAGIADVETMPVGFAIGRSNVRFYHDSDREGAEGASALLAGALDGAPEARDFTDYPTPTASGRVEIWLAGEAPRSTTPRQPKAPPAPVKVVEAEAPDPYAPLDPHDQVREVQRILLDRLQGN